jgi:integrase
MKSKDVPGIDARDAGKLLDLLAGSEAFAQVVLMIHTGLRRGEAFGLAWRSVDFDARVAVISHQMHLDGRIETLKTDKSHRSVDLAAPLVDMMRVWRKDQKEEALRLSRTPVEYVLGVEPADARRAYERGKLALSKAAKRVGIPGHVTHHTLRHAYASIQLSTGQDLVYVSQQLGHASVAITADLYGCHLRKRDQAAADHLASLISVKRVGLVRRR